MSEAVPADTTQLDVARPADTARAATAHGADAARSAAARRSHRAAVARALSARAPREADAVTWDALTHAPSWLALDDAALRMLRRRVGSVLLAPALRFWIVAAKVQAARAALGSGWWERLLAHEPWPTWSPEWGDWPAGTSSTADTVADVFEEAGSAVLLATLPHGALRNAAAGALAPVADLVLARAQAQAVFEIALQLLQAEAHELAASGAQAESAAAAAPSSGSNDAAADAPADTSSQATSARPSGAPASTAAASTTRPDGAPR